jgi:hypothetical protein
MSPIAGSVLDDFKKTITSLQVVIKAIGSPLGTPPKIDLAIDLGGVCLHLFVFFSLAFGRSKSWMALK